MIKQKRKVARSVEHPSRKRFLGYEELNTAAAEVSAEAKRAGVKIALLGGFALQLYGSDRLTTDLDFAGDGFLPVFPFKKELTFGGQQMVASNGVDVDIIVRSDHYRALYEDALYHATKMKGAPALVVRLEHLAVMKFASGRPKDLLDLTFMVTETNVDLVKVRKLLHKYLGVYAVQEFEQFVVEAQWRYWKDELEKGQKLLKIKVLG